jgi:phosphatidylserine decarboxylase
LNYPHPILAREGWPFIAITLVLAVWAHLSWSLPVALLLDVLAIFVIQFFRDPPRLVPQEEDVVISPADGRVIKVERTFDPYAEREAILISVFMNVFNVHSNRSSVDGVVRSVQYFPGSFFNASLDKASLENERNAMVIDAQFPSGVQTVTLVQVAGLVARRILCYVDPGAGLKKGQRYGFIRFGSRVDVYLPIDALVKVSPGDKVSATLSVLAKLG